MREYTTQEVIEKIESGGYKNIILDFDETVAHLIIDWLFFHVYMKEFADKYDIEKERGAMNTHAFCEFVLQKFGDEAKQEINDICEKVESEHLSDIVINRELVDFIKQNKEKYTFHILSNNMYATLEDAIKKIDLDGYFKIVLGRDSVMVAKPHPCGIEKIMQDQGGDKTSFIMIGDNPNSDIAAADRAGIDSLVINMHTK